MLYPILGIGTRKFFPQENFKWSHGIEIWSPYRILYFLELLNFEYVCIFCAIRIGCYTAL